VEWSVCVCVGGGYFDGSRTVGRSGNAWKIAVSFRFVSFRFVSFRFAEKEEIFLCRVESRASAKIVILILFVHT
jgi:hypothetical protein